ncbi:hypothetical protein K0U07_02220 [bacterium]|nr:hypothetical protein [bacterium]
MKYKLLTLLLSLITLKTFLQADDPRPTYPLSTNQFPYKAAASFTYWSPYSEGLNILTTKGNATFEGDIYSLPNTPMPGFKAMIGATTYSKLLDVTLQYAWFSNPKTTKGYGLALTTNYSSPFLEESEYFSTLDSYYENYFNKLLFLFEKNISQKDIFILRFKAGGIAAWDFQEIYFAGYSKSDPDMQERSTFTQNWYGGGPYLGGEASWTIKRNFSLFTEGGASLLLSHHSATQYMIERDQYNEDDRIITNRKIIGMALQPMVDINLGVRKSFYLKDLITTIGISWELQTYFFHNHFLPYYSPTGHYGNYSMQGLNISLDLDF